MKVFISGSKTIGKLNNDIKVKLQEFADAGYEILIGDCYGVDAAVQKYYAEIGYNNVTVYISGDEVRNNLGNNRVVHIPVDDGITGYEFYRQKDIAMAKEADVGFMIWDEKTKGTMNNIIKLNQEGKSAEVYSLVDNMLKTYSKQELLNILFDMWKKEHCNDINFQNNFPKIKGKELNEDFKGSFCADGFIYDNNEDCKILFICRESNVDGKKEANDYFWIKEIMHCDDGKYVGDNIEPKDKGMQTKYRKYVSIIAETLSCDIKNCAYMNINKRGGYGSCNGERLNTYAENYMNYILTEIQIINPEIVVFLGKDASKDRYVNDLRENMKNMKVEVCYQVKHPSSRISYKALQIDLEEQKGKQK